MISRLLIVSSMLVALAACAAPAPTLAPTAASAAASPSPLPATATPLPPTATPAPSATVAASATLPPPTSTSTATLVPTAAATASPASTATPAYSLSSQMGELVVTNNVGQYDLAFDLEGKKYTIPMGGGKITIDLPPGSHKFSVAKNQSWSFHCPAANNCTVQIGAGQTTMLSIDRSNYGD